MMEKCKFFSMWTVDRGRHSGEKVGNGQRTNYVLLGPEHQKVALMFGAYERGSGGSGCGVERRKRKEECKKGQKLLVGRKVLKPHFTPPITTPEWIQPVTLPRILAFHGN